MELTRFSPYTDHFHETGNQIHEWIQSQAHAYFQKYDQERSLLTSKSFPAWRQERVICFLRSIGGLPERLQPVPCEEAGRIHRSGYHIRKWIYQCLPGYHVTANLYVPDGLKARTAGVLFACGHSAEGKAAPKYQKLCLGLVKEGFVVLIFDSPSQGEMSQCLDPQSGQRSVGINTREHSHLQIPASIIGLNIARYFITSAMAGLDLLCALPEVDPDKIGMTGNSGGGTLTQYLTLLDPRIKAAMPGCSVTTRAHYLATGVRAYDGEQNLFGSISDGVDYADILAAIAPRPLQIGAAEYDYFALEGARKCHGQAREVYSAMGCSDHLNIVVAPEELHGYSEPLRVACIAWFCRHLLGRESSVTECDDEAEDPAALECTSSGQVLTDGRGAVGIIDLLQGEWEKTRSSAQSVRHDAKSLRQLLQIPDEKTTLHPRITKKVACGNHIGEHIFFFSEPGIIVTAVLYRGEKPPQGAAILLVPDGTEGQEPYQPWITNKLAKDNWVMVFDVRGTGAVCMRRRNLETGLAFRSTEFRVASDHFMLGTSLASRRAFDVLRALEYLRSRTHAWLQPNQVEIHASGWPSYYGLLAAVLDGECQLTIQDGLPESWMSAFSPMPHDSHFISESLLCPELAGQMDIGDLLAMAKAG